MKLFEDDTQCPHTGVNVNPYEVHANSNVGSHNIAIGGTLGWSKQQQGQSKQQQYCQYSPDAERRMQGKGPCHPFVNLLRSSVVSL